MRRNGVHFWALSGAHRFYHSARAIEKFATTARTYSHHCTAEALAPADERQVVNEIILRSYLHCSFFRTRRYGQFNGYEKNE